MHILETKNTFYQQLKLSIDNIFICGKFYFSNKGHNFKQICQAVPKVTFLETIPNLYWKMKESIINYDMRLIKGHEDGLCHIEKLTI